MNVEFINRKKTLGFIEKNAKIIGYRTVDYLFSAKFPNNVCLIRPFIPFKIEAFKKCLTGIGLVIGRRYENETSFFNEPVESISTLGICLVNNLPHSQLETFKIEQIECKLMCLPYNDQMLLIPILHGCTA